LRPIHESLLALHRKLGLGLCVLFAMWFASGIVMLFARYPQLTDDERLARSPALRADELLVEPSALPASDSATLVAVEGRPAYRLRGPEGMATVFADDGTAMATMSVARAAAEARRFLPGASAPVLSARIERPDQWTLAGHDGQFPLLRFAAADGAGTEIYVSEPTGAVVQSTTRSQRIWAWLGAIPHWIYPAILRRHRGPWRWLVIALASVGAVACLAGLAGGLLLARRHRPGFGSPYRKRWHRWHHLSGIAFGSLAFTWVLSGALSLNPMHWSPGSEPTPDQLAGAAGGALDLSEFSLSIADAVRACARSLTVRKVELRRIGGRPYYRCVERSLRTRLVAADATTARLRESLSPADLAALAQAALPEVPVAHAALTGPDAYEYLSPHGPQRRFPVFRADFADDSGTSLYLDPSSGAPVARHNRLTRCERWLYRGLHSLDLPGLYGHRRAWLAVIVPLLLGGLALSVTGLVLALRRARRAWPRRTTHHRTHPADWRSR
jgi:hypothetical protein